METDTTWYLLIPHHGTWFSEASFMSLCISVICFLMLLNSMQLKGFTMVLNPLD